MQKTTNSNLDDHLWLIHFVSLFCFQVGSGGSSRSVLVFPRHRVTSDNLWEKESWRKALYQIGHRCQSWSTTYAVSQPRWQLSVWAVSKLPVLENGNETVPHTQLLSKGFTWAGVQLHSFSITTLGEALALPFFKVRPTKRKCSARFIQRKLLMVGRQKVLHTILPGAHVL